MAELVVYVKGPESRKTGGILGIGGRDITIYSTNPQLYLDNVENPARNFGLYEIEFDQIPSEEDLENRIRLHAQEILGTGVPLGMLIISVDKIDVKIEYDN